MNKTEKDALNAHPIGSRNYAITIALIEIENEAKRLRKAIAANNVRGPHSMSTTASVIEGHVQRIRAYIRDEVRPAGKSLTPSHVFESAEGQARIMRELKR